MLCSHVSINLSHLCWCISHILNSSISLYPVSAFGSRSSEMQFLSFTTSRASCLFSCPHHLRVLQPQCFRFFSHPGQHSTCGICPLYLHKTKNSTSEATHHRFVSITIWLLVKGAGSSTVQKLCLPAKEGYYLLSSASTNISHVLGLSERELSLK